MKISDYKGVFNSATLTIEEITNPHSDYYEIKLLPAAGMAWQAGEHGIFKLPGKNMTGKKYRALSIASITKEGYMLLGTRAGKEISSYKKQLIAMQKGEEVSIRGPFGSFKIQDETSPIVMFASGVGITPIRALMKELENNISRAVEVVYASSEFYLYDTEISDIAKNNPKVNLYKTTSREETTEKLKVLAKQYGNSAFYYVSGAPKVISSTSELIVSLGVNKKRILSDPFMGY